MVPAIQHNVIMYGADGHLNDSADSSLSDVKVLEPGQDLGFSVDHDVGNSDADAARLKAHHADKVKVQIVNFDFDDLPTAAQPTTLP